MIARPVLLSVMVFRAYRQILLFAWFRRIRKVCFHSRSGGRVPGDEGNSDSFLQQFDSMFNLKRLEGGRFDDIGNYFSDLVVSQFHYGSSLSDFNTLLILHNSDLFKPACQLAVPKKR